MNIKILRHFRSHSKYLLIYYASNPEERFTFYLRQSTYEVQNEASAKWGDLERALWML